MNRLRSALRRPAGVSRRSMLRRGFSLAEVMVASVMVSIGAVGVAQGVTNIQAANNRANQALERAQIARTMSERYRAIPYGSLQVSQTVVWVNADGVVLSGQSYSAALYMVTVNVTQVEGQARKAVSVQVIRNPYRRAQTAIGGSQPAG